MYVIRIIGFASQDHCPITDQFVEAFDHDAEAGRGAGSFTRSLARAMKFDSFDDALSFWYRQSDVQPLREDGEPNRPLTACHASFELIAKVH